MSGTSDAQKIAAQRLEAVLTAPNRKVAQHHLKVVEAMLAQGMNLGEFDAFIAVLDEHGVPCSSLKRTRQLIADQGARRSQ